MIDVRDGCREKNQGAFCSQHELNMRIMIVLIIFVKAYTECSIPSFRKKRTNSIKTTSKRSLLNEPFLLSDFQLK